MTEPAPDGACVIAVNRFYWPDHSATSQILTDLATHLAGEGRPVIVITSRMRYDDSGKRLPAREIKDGVDIRRVWTSRMGRGGLAGRALDYLTFYLSAFVAVSKAARRGDVILVKTDPPLISVITWIVAGLKGARVVTWNQDLFPEFAAALGISLAGSRFGRALRWLRNRSLLSAEMNIAICEPMANEIARQGVDPDRIRVIHNWSDAGLRPVEAQDNPLRAAWGLDETFVIAYSGNLGRAHMAEKVAELVRRTHDLPDLAWLFIGGGSGLVHIERLIEETGATNIQIRPYQSRDDLSLSLSAADLHLVSLEPACEGLLSPSKLYGIMAAGRPTLFLGQADGALARELARDGIGINLDVERPDRWRAAIKALRAAPGRVAEMGARARALSEAVYHPAHALGAWSAALEAVLEVAARDRAPAASGRLVSPALAGSPVGVIARAAGLGRGLGEGLRQRIPRAAFLALGFVITLLALYPDLHLAALQALKDATEPLGHTAAFAALTVVGAITWGLTLPLLAGLSGLAAWLELTQYLVPGREPDLAQVAGGLAGILLGLILARLWRMDRHWLAGQVARKAARLRAPGLGQGGSSRGRWQGLNRVIPGAAFFAVGLAITALTLYPNLHLAALQALKDATEPLGHTAAFTALTVIGAITWGRLTLPLLAGLSGLAVSLELTQFLAPGREPDLAQVAGSLAGILLGLILTRYWARARHYQLL